MVSIHIGDQKVINKFISNPDFPYLISFPRTGSHWLRMIMELYFETPSLVRIFYYKNADTFTCYHRHDEDLNIQRKNVLYLYRNPTDTIYSQLNYYKEAAHDIERIRYWANLYGKHLAKWLVEEIFTGEKTIVTYEGMKEDMAGEFQKICCHFSVPFNPGKLKSAVKKASPAEVKRKNPHDLQVINLSKRYKEEKENFRIKYSDFILDIICSQNQALGTIFPGMKEK